MFLEMSTRLSEYISEAIARRKIGKYGARDLEELSSESKIDEIMDAFATCEFKCVVFNDDSSKDYMMKQLIRTAHTEKKPAYTVHEGYIDDDDGMVLIAVPGRKTIIDITYDTKTRAISKIYITDHYMSFNDRFYKGEKLNNGIERMLGLLYMWAPNDF